MNCKECRGPCLYTSSALTCTQCGLEQGAPVFTDEIDVFDRVCPFNQNDFKEAPSHAYESRKRALFDRLETDSRLPASVVDIAKDMYDAFNKEVQVKGDQRHLEVACACLAFASRTMPSGAVTHEGLCLRVKGVSSFAWASREISWALRSNANFAGLFKERMPTINDSVTKMLRLVCEDLEESQGKSLAKTGQDRHNGWYKKMRPVVLKLQDKIRGRPELHTHNPEKINATLIMMAAKFVKAPLTMRRIGIITGTSEPTLLKMEKLVQSFVRAVRI